MDELWRYHKKENWEHFLAEVVPVEFKKNEFFYNEIKKGLLFPEDVYKVLATLSEFMFEGKLEKFHLWLNTRQPILNWQTPLELMHHPHGIEWLKEYLLRYPKI